MSGPKLKKKIENMYKVKRFSQMIEQKEFGSKTSRALKKAWEASEANKLGFKEMTKDATQWVRSAAKNVTDKPANIHESINIKNQLKPLANVASLSRSPQLTGNNLAKYRKASNGSLMKIAYDHGKPGVPVDSRIKVAKEAMKVSKLNKNQASLQ